MVGDVITVEVAYARSDEQRIIELQVPPGTTARDAVEKSGLGEFFPEIDLTKVKLGIFGKIAKPDVALQAGDRVEIYRPLIADPKEQRKKKAAEGKVMRRGAREANAQQDEESAE
jgi:uncharacterized protein